MNRLAAALTLVTVAVTAVVMFAVGILRRRKNPEQTIPPQEAGERTEQPRDQEAPAAEGPRAFAMVAATFEHLSAEFEELEREAALLESMVDTEAEEPAEHSPVAANAETEPPQSEQWKPIPAAESAMAQGNAFFQVGQYGLAIEQYTRALEADPRLAAAYYNRANARTRAGDLDEALADYDRAVAAQPEDPDALTNRGLLQLQRKDFPAAVRDFDAALALDPTDTGLLVNRGLAYLESGDAARSLQDFQEAISLNPGDAAAHYAASRAEGMLGRGPAALLHIRRALQLDPRFARDAASEPALAVLAGDPEFLQLLRDSGGRTNAE